MAGMRRVPVSRRALHVLHKHDLHPPRGSDDRNLGWCESSPYPGRRAALEANHDRGARQAEFRPSRSTRYSHARRRPDLFRQRRRRGGQREWRQHLARSIGRHDDNHVLRRRCRAIEQQGLRWGRAGRRDFSSGSRRRPRRIHACAGGRRGLAGVRSGRRRTRFRLVSRPFDCAPPRRRAVGERGQCGNLERCLAEDTRPSGRESARHRRDGNRAGPAQGNQESLGRHEPFMAHQRRWTNLEACLTLF